MSWTAARFSLTSEECELLLELEQAARLQDVAERLGRDHSVIARALKRIAEKLPVVEKRSGRWMLTEMGLSMNEISRATIAQQAALVKTRARLTIGTNREFATRILAPDLKAIQNLLPQTFLGIQS